MSNEIGCTSLGSSRMRTWRSDSTISYCTGPIDMSSGAVSSSRLPRTVHCSRPRETPPKPSMMPRLWYFPSPKSTWSDPSVLAIDTQIFSVQARSDSATVANVSAIWWFSPSSAAPQRADVPRCHHASLRASSAEHRRRLVDVEEAGTDREPRRRSDRSGRLRWRSGAPARPQVAGVGQRSPAHRCWPCHTAAAAGSPCPVSLGQPVHGGTGISAVSSREIAVDSSNSFRVLVGHFDA